MKILVVQHRDKAELLFGFDREVVNIIKKVKDSWFNKNNRRWYCPLSSLEDLLIKADSLSLQVIFDYPYETHESVDGEIVSEQNTTFEQSMLCGQGNTSHNRHDHTSDSIYAKLNSRDHSISIDLPLPKNIYSKLKSALRNLIWNDNKWIIAKEDKQYFYNICLDNSISVKTY